MSGELLESRGPAQEPCLFARRDRRGLAPHDLCGWPERGGRCRRDTTYYVEDGDQGAEWRRLVYRIVSENAYEELMYRESADGWGPRSRSSRSNVTRTDARTGCRLPYLPDGSRLRRVTGRFQMEYYR